MNFLNVVVYFVALYPEACSAPPPISTLAEGTVITPTVNLFLRGLGLGRRYLF